MTPLDISSEPDQRTLGTRIDGMDLTGPLGDDVVAEIRALWMQHAVIVFSD
ncbi:MAG: TauD/TfdA family dioxygenase, partial [Rhodospirillaceae bacterium]|nr:TauD/TfdA family dioxygenase [Rhodospirillaceae bacterium]